MLENADTRMPLGMPGGTVVPGVVVVPGIVLEGATEVEVEVVEVVVVIGVALTDTTPESTTGALLQAARKTPPVSSAAAMPAIPTSLRTLVPLPRPMLAPRAHFVADPAGGYGTGPQRP